MARGRASLSSRRAPTVSRATGSPACLQSGLRKDTAMHHAYCHARCKSCKGVLMVPAVQHSLRTNSYSHQPKSTEW